MEENGAIEGDWFGNFGSEQNLFIGKQDNSKVEYDLFSQFDSFDLEDEEKPSNVNKSNLLDKL